MTWNSPKAIMPKCLALQEMDAGAHFSRAFQGILVSEDGDFYLTCQWTPKQSCNEDFLVNLMRRALADPACVGVHVNTLTGKGGLSYDAQLVRHWPPRNIFQISGTTSVQYSGQEGIWRGTGPPVPYLISNGWKTCYKTRITVVCGLLFGQKERLPFTVWCGVLGGPDFVIPCTEVDTVATVRKALAKRLCRQPHQVEFRNIAGRMLKTTEPMHTMASVATQIEVANATSLHLQAVIEQEGSTTRFLPNNPKEWIEAKSSTSSYLSSPRRLSQVTFRFEVNGIELIFRCNQKAFTSTDDHSLYLHALPVSWCNGHDGHVKSLLHVAIQFSAASHNIFRIVQFSSQDWMVQIKDNVALSQLIIPGIYHNKKTLGDVMYHLQGGKRAFEAPFDTLEELMAVMTVCRSFLSSQPTEAVFIFLMNPSKDTKAAFEYIESSWSNVLWWFSMDDRKIEAAVTKVKHARGKIVLISGRSEDALHYLPDLSTMAASERRDFHLGTIRSASPDQLCKLMDQLGNIKEAGDKPHHDNRLRIVFLDSQCSQEIVTLVACHNSLMPSYVPCPSDNHGFFGRAELVDLTTPGLGNCSCSDKECKPCEYANRDLWHRLDAESQDSSHTRCAAKRLGNFCFLCNTCLHLRDDCTVEQRCHCQCHVFGRPQRGGTKRGKKHRDRFWEKYGKQPHDMTSQDH